LHKSNLIAETKNLIALAFLTVSTASCHEHSGCHWHCIDYVKMKQAFPNLRIRIKVIPRFFRWYACHGLVFVGLLGGSTVATAKRRADTRLSIPRQLKRSLKDLREAGSKRSREIFQNLAVRLLEPDSVAAMHTVRKILSSVDDHGIVDVFAKYRSRDVLLSIYALSRLQDAVAENDRRRETYSAFLDNELITDLAHYSVYASVAYGWKMHFAFGGGLHLGDLQVLLKRTGIFLADLLEHKKESKAHRPAYFIVRDRSRRKLVLCIRGTLSAHDLLTDLCCSPDEYELPRSTSRSRIKTLSDYWWNGGSAHIKMRAHQGMLQASRLLKKDAEDLIRSHLKENPGFSLVLVGHSMGGGVAALLGTLWEDTFENLQVYVFGPPCVSCFGVAPTGTRNIVSVISDGDPFRSFSLGHVADLSIGVALLCDDPHLRRMILMKTNGRTKEIGALDLQWCVQTMKRMRGDMKSEKLFPPGRLLLLSSKGGMCKVREVPTEFFGELAINHKMFDVSKHIPARYESILRSILEHRGASPSVD
jgi:hypothetical protein